MCRERCGAQGLFSVNRIVDYISLVQGLVTAEGDSQVLLATTAGQQLAQHVGTSRPTEQAASLPELDLLTRRTQLIANRYHKTRNAEDDATTAFQGLNAAAPIAIAFGNSWIIERAVLSLLDSAQSLTDANAQQVIVHLARIAACADLLRDPFDLLAAGSVDPAEPAQWRERLLENCTQIDADVDQLIEAFQLTPELLRAPIAETDYAAAFLAHCTGANDIEFV